MPLLNFSNLDFDQIKTTLIDYLRSNSDFTDYDFEGSNLSTIIDVLAYNTYITSYNANMVSNEVFIDSATLRENVVALARNIGYVPRSKKSSRVSIDFFVDVSNINPAPATVVLKKGPVASTGGQFNQQSFIFGITADKTVNVVDGIASFDELEIYEGTVVSQTFTSNSRDKDDRVILSNYGIELDTLLVSIKPSASSSVSLKYSRQDNLFDSGTGSAINGNSRIYYIQEIEDERYEIIFGDGVFGKKLEDGNVVEVSYVRTSGESANGVSSFAFSGRLAYTKGSIEYNITSGISLIGSVLPSSGGEPIESVDSVKKYAPQIYATQNRALTANDYEILIPNKVYPEAESISVYGGEDLIPPQYGKVFISIKPKNANYISNFLKSEIQRKLKNYSIAGIIPTITDLKYLYIEAQVGVYYNTSRSSGTNSSKTHVLKAIEQYADSTELNKFAGRFKYSRFLAALDQSDPSITSSYALIRMRRNLRPVENAPADYEICFGNSIRVNSDTGYTVSYTHLTLPTNREV